MNLPNRPVIVFDGQCGFCRSWIDRFRARTGERVEYVPFQAPEVPQRFPTLSRDSFARAVHLIEPSGAIASGALAVFRLLALSRPAARASSSTLTWMYERVPGVAWLSEAAYRFVANHRGFFSKL